MAVLNDEVLMAYADSALDSDIRARVEAILLMDAEARRRLEVFRATGGRLAQLYQRPMLEPVPAHLVDFVLGYGQNGATPLKQRGFMATLGAWRSQLTTGATWEKLGQRASWNIISQGITWQLAAASAAALLIGVSAGYTLRGSGGDGSAEGQNLAVFKDGQIFAGGTLRRVLETMPSGQEARVAGGAQDSTVVRASLTFKSKAGGFCREYEVESVSSGQFSGLACREGHGAWALEAHVAEAPATPGAESSPAGHGALLDPIVTGMMEGIAFGKKEEGAAITGGWK